MRIKKLLKKHHIVEGHNQFYNTQLNFKKMIESKISPERIHYYKFTVPEQYYVLICTKYVFIW